MSTNEIENLPYMEKYNPYQKAYLDFWKESVADIRKFWDQEARKLLWYRTWDKVLDDSNPPFYRWFVGGETNMTLNALDRWKGTHVFNKVAYYWEGEDGTRRSVSYRELYEEVNRFSKALQDLGVGPNSTVTIYLPMIPELPIAMLSVVRLGAIHSVVFSGFSAQALADRIVDAKSKVLITADAYPRRGKPVETKKTADDAVAIAEKSGVSVEHVVVVRRLGTDVPWKEGRDLWYHELMSKYSDTTYVRPEPRKGDDILYMLYTSGTTGKPKGIMHSVGGNMVYVHSVFKWNWDIRPEDVHWTMADVGWVTGHTYIVYGPLLHGATEVLYEGAIDYPKPDRPWEMIERYGVTIFYTSPTAERALRAYGDEWVDKHEMPTLRILGTVGEPINPDVWHWYNEHVGKGRCPIVDTWWMTETSAAMISPAPGIATVTLKPGSATFPLPGIVADVLDEDGKPTPPGVKGYLVIKQPWPGMPLGIWGDPDRFVKVYFSRFPPYFQAGDYAVRDEEGYFWLLGRADEVLKVAGHRLGTIEMEDALLKHPAVAESLVIGMPDPTKGEVPVAAVVLKPGYKPSEELKQELIKVVRDNIGAIATPETVLFVPKVPKTRSGKIMRRLLRDILLNRQLGDATTLEDPSAVEALKAAWDEFKSRMGS
ncbi:MAG: acetate--CoA ligase [Conexivisphaera sp.]